MKPSAQRYESAKGFGEQARRNGQPHTANPWRSANNEHDQLLRDAWHDAWMDEDKRRRRA